MLLEQTVDKLNQMKLFGMASSLKERLSKPDHQDLSSADLFGLIIDDEWMVRNNRKTQSKITGARFKEKNVCVENILNGFHFLCSGGFFHKKQLHKDTKTQSIFSD